eukprot:1591907-Alexandrium_andersonii.AAC.1
MATDWRCGCGEDNWSTRYSCRRCNRRAPQSVIARNLAARRAADQGAVQSPPFGGGGAAANIAARRASTGGPEGRNRRSSKTRRRKRSVPRALDAQREVGALLAGDDPIATAGTRPSPFSAVHRVAPVLGLAGGAEAAPAATPVATASG